MAIPHNLTNTITVACPTLFGVHGIIHALYMHADNACIMLLAVQKGR